MKDCVLLATIGKTDNNSFKYECFSTFRRNEEKLDSLDFPKIRKLLDKAGVFYAVNILHHRTGRQVMFAEILIPEISLLSQEEIMDISKRAQESGAMGLICK